MPTATEPLTGTAYVAAFILGRCRQLGIKPSERALAKAAGGSPCQAWWQQRMRRGVYDVDKELRTRPEDATLAGFAQALQMSPRDARLVFETAMGVGAGRRGEPQRLRDLRSGAQPPTRGLVFREPAV